MSWFPVASKFCECFTQVVNDAHSLVLTASVKSMDNMLSNTYFFIRSFPYLSGILSVRHVHFEFLSRLTSNEISKLSEGLRLMKEEQCSWQAPRGGIPVIVASYSKRQYYVFGVTTTYAVIKNIQLEREGAATFQENSWNLWHLYLC